LIFANCHKEKKLEEQEEDGCGTPKSDTTKKHDTNSDEGGSRHSSKEKILSKSKCPQSLPANKQRLRVHVSPFSTHVKKAVLLNSLLFQ